MYQYGDVSIRQYINTAMYRYGNVANTLMYWLFIQGLATVKPCPPLLAQAGNYLYPLFNRNAVEMLYHEC